MDQQTYRNRSILLWIGLGWIFGADTFLHMYSPHVGNDNSSSNRRGASEAIDRSPSGRISNRDVDNQHRVLCDIVKHSRDFAIVITFSNLIANELSFLYCGGHTVLATLLAALSRKLSFNHSYFLAFKLLALACMWNRFWLSETNPLLQKNYKDLISLSLKLKDQASFRKYSRMLADLQMERFRQSTQKTADFVGAVAKKGAQMNASGFKRGWRWASPYFSRLWIGR